MAKELAVKNVSNRPLSLVFDDGTVNIFPKTTTEYFKEERLIGSLAERQLKKYVADREAKVLEREVKVTTTTKTPEVSK